MVPTTPPSQDFADRLRLAMRQAGLDGYGAATELARQLNVTPKAVSKWLQGLSIPASQRLRPLAEILNVEAEWLLWGIQKSPSGIERAESSGSKHSAAHAKHTHKTPTEAAPPEQTINEGRPAQTTTLEKNGRAAPREQDGESATAWNAKSLDSEWGQHPDIIPISVWDDDTPVDDDEVEVPFLREVMLSAGSGRTVIQESSRAKLRFGKLTLRKHSVQFDQAVCVPVHGNSMEPVLPDGSTVAINKGATNVVDGKIYAIAHSGQLRVKTLYRLPGGGIRMRSFNREEHPDEEYTASEMEDKEIRILGRVFWSAAFH